MKPGLTEIIDGKSILVPPEDAVHTETVADAGARGVAGGAGASETSKWAEQYILQMKPGGGADVQTHGVPSIDGYAIRERLGRGGMGSVFRALDQRLQVEVALKVPQSLRAGAREQFLSEAKRLAQVEHRNVVPVRACGECRGQAYFTMPLMEGPDGTRLVAEFRRVGAHEKSGDEILRAAGLDPVSLEPELARICRSTRPYYRIVAHWLAGVADGLEAAHRKGILHRDIKPGNLLMNGDGRLMLADFGLAATQEDLLGRGAGVSGTYPYVAPERVAGDQARIDRRSDVWGLGAALYEFLAYRRAYATEGRDVLREIATRDCTPPRSHCDAIPRTLGRICLKAMQRDPARRYETAAQMAAELRRFAAGERVSRRVVVPGAIVFLVIAAVGRAYLYAGHASHAGPVQQDTVSAESPAAQTPGDQQERGDVEDKLLARAVGETEIAEAVAPTSQSVSGEELSDEHATPSVRRIMLAVNQDLNAADALPARAGGLVEARLRSALGGGHDIFLVEPSDRPEAWSQHSAIGAAAACKADIIVMANFTASPNARRTDGPTVERSLDVDTPAGDAHVRDRATVYTRARVHWRMTLEVSVVEVGTSRTLWHRNYEDRGARAEEAEYGGDAHGKLARVAGAELLQALESLLAGN